MSSGFYKSTSRENSRMRHYFSTGAMGVTLLNIVDDGCYDDLATYTNGAISVLNLGTNFPADGFFVGTEYSETTNSFDDISSYSNGAITAPNGGTLNSSTWGADGFFIGTEYDESLNSFDDMSSYSNGAITSLNGGTLNGSTWAANGFFI